MATMLQFPRPLGPWLSTSVGRHNPLFFIQSFYFLFSPFCEKSTIFYSVGPLFFIQSFPAALFFIQSFAGGATE